jgi:DNA-binding SARP family transcriptional activator
MEFRLLGPVEVVAAERPVDLGHRRQRLVLAVLALEPNRLIPIGRLIGLSWPNSPPRTATHAIQVSASQLRLALARANCEQHQVNLVGKGSGYMLRADTMDIDAHRFRAMVAEARSASSDEHKVAILRRALQLWRGPVLTGIAPDETRDALGRGLEEARLVALEDRIEAELRLARHRELLDELAELVEVHPLRERLTGQLMRALYWSGQAGAALAAFRRTRMRMAEELGIDPGAELRRLELALLRNDAALAAPPELARPGSSEPAAVPGASPGTGRPGIAEAVAPAQLPPVVADFTGRVPDLLRLTALAQERDESVPAPVIVTITGPAGVGKSALAAYWAQLSRPAFSDGQLFLDLRGFAAGPPVTAAAAVGRFLRALGVVTADIPRDADQAAAMYRTILADRQMLILLDNAATAQQVRPLIPAAPGCLILVTSRSKLTGLTALNGARSLTLGALRPDEARTLLTRILGPCRIGAEPAAAAQLASLCGYLPLTLRTAAAEVASRPAVSLRGWMAELESGHAGKTQLPR